MVGYYHLGHALEKKPVKQNDEGIETVVAPRIGLYPLVFTLGFLIGTAVNHLAGVTVGLVSARVKDGPQFLCYLGAGITGIGLYILHISVKF